MLRKYGISNQRRSETMGNTSCSSTGASQIPDTGQNVRPISIAYGETPPYSHSHTSTPGYLGTFTTARPNPGTNSSPIATKQYSNTKSSPIATTQYSGDKSSPITTTHYQGTTSSPFSKIQYSRNISQPISTGHTEQLTHSTQHNSPITRSFSDNIDPRRPAPLAKPEGEKPKRKLSFNRSIPRPFSNSPPSSKMDDLHLSRSTATKNSDPCNHDNEINNQLLLYSHSFTDIPSTIQAEKEELQSLRREVFVLRQELTQCKTTIAKLNENEKKLQHKVSEHAQRSLSVSHKFEDLTLGDTRPTQLIRRYGNLYSEARLDAFDALDCLPEISDLDDLKGKLLFSIVVLAFRSVQATLKALKEQLRRLLCMPGDITHNASAREVEDTVCTYLRKSVDQYDLSTNVTEVCTQVWMTLYDYPGLKTCLGLKAYMEDCVRVSWGLTVQAPGYVIKYDSQEFDPRLFTRFHAADLEGETIKTVLWPALLEGENGPCVHKGVVLT